MLLCFENVPTFFFSSMKNYYFCFFGLTKKKNTAVVLSTAIGKRHIMLEKYIFLLIAVYNTVHFV